MNWEKRRAELTSEILSLPMLTLMAGGIVRELRHYVSKHGHFTLVEVISSEGNHIKNHSLTVQIRIKKILSEGLLYVIICSKEIDNSTFIWENCKI